MTSQGKDTNIKEMGGERKGEKKEKKGEESSTHTHI
jgi:hypothetical protein